MLYMSSCRCTKGEWTRARRAAWMRVFSPTRRLFECSTCHRRFLVRPDTPEAGDKIRAAAIVMCIATIIGLGALSLWRRSTDAQSTSAAIPTSQLLSRPAAASCQRVHIFKQGETFETIAEQELGDPSKWQEIRMANHWLDLAENGLEPGARLVIPAPCAG